jgi:23S rRNA (guanosine2251-2'-O)-methyltransferase
MADLVFGLHSVTALLERRAPEVQEVWVLAERRDRRLGRIVDLAARRGLPLHEVDKATLDRMAEGARHQGVVARFEGRPPLGEPDIDPLLDQVTGHPLILVLDGVQDPHNLGACLRTAEAAGAHLVILPKDRAVGVTPTVRKVASGAADLVPVATVPNLARVLDGLVRRGITVAGLDADGTTDLHMADLRGALALVLGAEGGGLRRLTRESCSRLLRIPMFGTVESLNVSVAAGVCLFEVARQRRVG